MEGEGSDPAIDPRTGPGRQNASCRARLAIKDVGPFLCMCVYLKVNPRADNVYQ